MLKGPFVLCQEPTSLTYLNDSWHEGIDLRESRWTPVAAAAPSSGLIRPSRLLAVVGVVQG